MTMSRNDDFVRFSDIGSLTSESEYELPDTRPSSELNGQQFSRRRDYWFGKKYFECIIAQGIFEETVHDDSIESADSSFEEALRIYPYQRAVEQLRARVSDTLSSGYLPRGASHYTILMTFLGMTVRMGEKKDKVTILEIIRSCQGKGISDVESIPSTVQSANGKFKSESPVDDRLSNLEENDGPSIDTYTSRLKEIGDQEGWRPEYKVSRYPKDQSLFQATVSFDGQILEGRPARNTRLAKHWASKAACDFIDHQRTKFDVMTDY